MDSENISRLLVKILRHKAKERNIEMDPENFVKVKDVLSQREFKGVTHDDITKIVEIDPKNRYSLKVKYGDLMIRANRGHTIDEHILKISDLHINEKKLVHLSKLLAYVLRHRAEGYELKMDPDHFVKIDDLLSRGEFCNYSCRDIKHVVECDKKKRFSLKTVHGALMIGAEWGHSFETETAGVKKDINLSKLLAAILRRRAEKMNIPMDNEGFVKVKDLLNCKELQHVNFDDLQRIAMNDKKGRYIMKEKSDGSFIFAAKWGRKIPRATAYYSDDSD